MLRRLLARARDERGIALVFAVVAMAAIVASVSTVMYFASESGHQSTRSRSQDIAYQLALAGINKASSDLHGHDSSGNPVNAQDPALLPSQASPETDTFSDLNGTATWYGSFDSTKLQWTITSTGSAPNPAGGGNTTRTVTAQINVVYDFSQPLNAQAWNYLYASHTGSTCDMTTVNSLVLQASLWVEGNLCMNNTSSIMPATAPPSPAPAVNLVVKGSLTINNSAHVGTSTQKINLANIVGGCNGHQPCRWNGGGDQVFANNVSSSAPGNVPLPVPQWDYWYANANPGPQHNCSSSSGTPPVFENQVSNPTRNNSVPTTFNLTPASSDYTCLGGGGSQISWNHSTQTLTVYGAIFIDGSATVTASLAKYVGSATLYLSGTFTMSNSSKLCGGISGASCDFGSWDPNSNMLIIVANGNDGSGNSIALNNSVYFQGGFEATNNIMVSNSAQFEGPMIGSSLNINNSVSAKPFPLISNVPLGAPGNPNVYADPQNPTNYNG